MRQGWRQRRHIATPGSRLDQLRLDALTAKAAGNLDQAVDLARRYLARRPNDSGVLSFLAKDHHERHDWAQFLSYGRRSYAVEPIREHLRLLYLAYERLEHHEAAVKLCKGEFKGRYARLFLTEPHFAIELVFKMGRATLVARWDARVKRKAARRAAAARVAARTKPAEAHRDPLHSVNGRRVADRSRNGLPAWPHREPPPVEVEIAEDPSGLSTELCAAFDDPHADPPKTISLLHVHLKHAGLAERFHAEFSTLNVRVEWIRAHEETTEYLGVSIFYTTDGPDAVDGVGELWVNSRTLAVMELPLEGSGVLHAPSEPRTETSRLITGDLARRLTRCAVHKSGPYIRRELHDSVACAQTALNNDFHTLEQEYRKAWEQRLAEPLPEGDPERGLLHRECGERIHRFEHRVRELAGRDAVRVRVDPIDLRRVRIPVMVGTVRMTRRQSSRTIITIWNPLTRHFEPVRCSRCGEQSHALGATEAAELLCARCVRH